MIDFLTLNNSYMKTLSLLLIVFIFSSCARHFALDETAKICELINNMDSTNFQSKKMVYQVDNMTLTFKKSRGGYKVSH